MKPTRRQFLATALAGGAATLAGCRRPEPMPGSIHGGSSALGHRLRTGGFPAPDKTEEVDTVIVGGGIAGLAAARRLTKTGADFLLLELEPTPGGNSASGRNEVSAYPWGAHYLPLPNSEATEITALLEELGLITGRDSAGRAIYDDFALCSDPVDRLFTCGRWQEGLLPQLGITADDRRQYAEFFAYTDRQKNARGRDGRRAFAIPLDLSSRDPELLALDRFTMAEFMDQHGWNSEPLRWFVDYSCRDDYGAGIRTVSAWAAIHYFAGRDSVSANAAPDAVLTWPEGNAWLVDKIAAPLRSRIRSRCLAWKIEAAGTHTFVEYFDASSKRSIRIKARAVICATPRFIAQRLVRDLPSVPLDYSPWMVANLTLDSLPTGTGAALAWDNVARDSPSLGYIVATHQSLRSVPRRTVLTHYWPLDRDPPKVAREKALARTHASWCEEIITDLERIHRGITDHVRQIDIWLWGHGMIRPVPGFLWGETRAQLAKPHGSIFFAHSDLSGISIFEEAYTRGVQAADAVRQHLG